MSESRHETARKLAWSSIRTKPKVLLAVSIPLVLLIALGMATLSSISKIRDTAGWVDHTRAVLAKSQDIVAAAVNMETGMRGFLLAGKDQFLEPYDAGQAAVYDLIEDLQKVVSDNPKQVARLDDVRETLKDWQANVTEPMIALRRSVGDSVTMEDIAARVGEAKGKVYFDKFRQLMADFSNEEGSLMAVRKQQNDQTEQTTRIVVIGGTLLAIGLGGGLGWWIGNGIAGPITRMTDAMKRLADGDKTTEVPGTGRGDEIGAMAAAVNVFKENMIKADELAEREKHETEAREERARRIETLTRDFDTGVSELLGTVASASTEMESTAVSMSGIAEDTNMRASNVASAAQQAAANVQTVAAATEELSSSIDEIARQVSQSSQIAGRAVEQATSTDQQVQGLSLAAQRIGEVVKLISDIAEQTNLLALNATIEAARAGEAGKGFAVVAAEVKELASQTGKATEEISQQINSIQLETEGAVEAIQSIGATISDINEIASSIASAVEEQTTATREIARNVEEAAAGTEQVTSNIQEVTRGASETGAAATQVTSTASELSGKSEQLKTQVERFLQEVRAA